MLRLPAGIEVHQVPLPYVNIYGGQDSVNAYFLRRGANALLIDTGKDLPEHRELIEAYWRQLGEPRVSHVLLTHGHTDHAGNARHFGKRFGADVYLPAADLHVLRRAHPEWTPEVLFAHGATISTSVTDIQAIHTPGHSPGHHCFVAAGSHLLFAGDMILPHMPALVARPDGDMKMYLHSLNVLRDLDLDQVAPGHGPVVDHARRRITTLLEHRIRREGEIIGVLRTGPHSLDELTDIFYAARPGSEARRRAGTIMLDAHLHKLATTGRAAVQDDRWQLVTKDHGRRHAHRDMP